MPIAYDATTARLPDAARIPATAMAKHRSMMLVSGGKDEMTILTKSAKFRLSVNVFKRPNKHNICYRTLFKVPILQEAACTRWNVDLAARTHFAARAAFTGKQLEYIRMSFFS